MKDLAAKVAGVEFVGVKAVGELELVAEAIVIELTAIEAADFGGIIIASFGETAIGEQS